MELREILLIIWKRVWLIVLGTVLFSAFVFVISLNMQPVYEARVLLVVEQSSSALSSEYATLSGGEDLALTYSTLLKTRPIMEIVIANLNLDLAAEDLAEEMVTTNLVPGTQLLELTVQDTDAQRASDIANEIAFTFISLRDTEKKLERIQLLEQDVVLQMEILRDLIARNQESVPNSTVSQFTEEELALAESALSNQQLTYAQLMQTYLNIGLIQGQLLDVSIVEPAVAPRTPVRPNIVLYTFLGTCIGFTSFMGIAFLREYLDRTVKTSDDVRRLLSLPTLGSLYKTQDKENVNGLVTLILPNSPESEAYRALRTNLRFVSLDAPLQTLLITSAVAAEGKTTLAANLGVVCAQAGMKVLLIDSDFRRPTLHRRFQLPNYLGLTDFLVGNIDSMEECMFATEIEGLSLIPTGEIPPNPSELLGSEAMTAAIEAVQQLADLVIIDTPPTLVVSDALALAPKADGIVMVIEAGRTSFDSTRKAIESFQQVGSRIFGTVLTKVKYRSRDSYGYYYYSRNVPKESYLTKIRKQLEERKQISSGIDIPEKPEFYTEKRPLIVPGDVKYMMALVMASILMLLPSGLRAQILERFSHAVARFWFVLDRRTRRRVARHLRMIFSVKYTGANLPSTEAGLSSMVRNHLSLTIWNALILNLLPSFRDEDLAHLVKFEGLDKLGELRRKKVPVLLMGAHYGIYGYAVAAALTASGYPTCLVGYGGQRIAPAKMSQLYNWLYWPRVKRLETRLKQATVRPGEVAQPELVNILAEETHLFYLLPDQYFIIGDDKIPPYLKPVQLLGRTAYLDTNVIWLAKQMGAQAFIAIPHSTGHDQRIRLEMMEWSSLGMNAEDIARDLQVYVKHLEDRLTTNPGLWRDLRRLDLLPRLATLEKDTGSARENG